VGCEVQDGGLAGGTGLWAGQGAVQGGKSCRLWAVQDSRLHFLVYLCLVVCVRRSVLVFGGQCVAVYLYLSDYLYRHVLEFMSTLRVPCIV
jgi:hypothetical protein